MVPNFPIFISLKDNNCTIVGGGAYASACADLLLRFGAKVTVISPQLCEHLRELDRAGEIRHIPRKFFRGDCATSYLCIAATDSDTVNIAVSVECKARNIPVHVASPSVYGTFALPQVVRSDSWIVGVRHVGRESAEHTAALCGKLEQALPALLEQVEEESASL